jgi:hypothetical protein
MSLNPQRWLGLECSSRLIKSENPPGKNRAGGLARATLLGRGVAIIVREGYDFTSAISTGLLSYTKRTGTEADSTNSPTTAAVLRG